MSKELPPRVPDELLGDFGDADLEAVAASGQAYPLLTVGDDGWPHVALLSVGEIVPIGASALRIAVWRESTSTRNLETTPRATLLAVHGGSTYYLRLAAEREDDLSIPGPILLARFRGTIEEARVDSVPYATVDSGIRFTLDSPADVLPRWRSVRGALGGVGPP